MMLSNGKVAKMPNKLTDNEIIKALECCIGDTEGRNCFDCPLYETDDCQSQMYLDALDLINRLQAENEELAYKLGCLLCHATGGKLSKHTYPLGTMESYVNYNIQEYCEEAEAEVKAEAYKECIEKVKEEIYSQPHSRSLEASVERARIIKIFDNLLKEMIGE